MPKSMRIAIDARYWRSSIQTGVERYVHLILEMLATVDKRKIRVALVLRQQETNAFSRQTWKDLEIQVLPVSDRSNRSLFRALAIFRPTVVHFPFELPTELHFPSVFTLHDAGRYLFPHLMVRTVREVQNIRFRQMLGNPLLKAVITVSESSRVDILNAIGNLGRPLIVVPNFVSRSFLRRLKALRPLRPALKPFLFGVGVYMPTKNIPMLCRAFRRARRVAPEIVPSLLYLAGRRGWERGLPVKLDSDIVALGHVGEDQLIRLYATATAFVFPSLYEGFGIPAQEALAARRPVLCSDIPVFHEITQGLAILANSREEKSLADGIISVCLSKPPNPNDVKALLERYSPVSAAAPLIDIYSRASNQT